MGKISMKSLSTDKNTQKQEKTRTFMYVSRQSMMAEQEGFEPSHQLPDLTV